MLSIIIPCFNEEEAIPLFFTEMENMKKTITHDLEYIFINDGSKDLTLQVLRDLAIKHNFVRYISFSRNFGKEAALYAGLQAATGDLITVMDVDLQDPPELLPKMIEMIETSDVDCVGTRRADRKGEPPIRSFFAKKFYQLINKISDTEMVDGARDYRLMTRQMVDAILELTEHNRFSKGLFSWVGFKTEYISFANRERSAGETSWSFWKSCFAAVIAMIFIIIRALIFGDPTSGWPSMVTIILFIGGVQLLCIGIIGKYIGKIFMETKKRPVYIVKETEKKLEK